MGAAMKECIMGIDPGLSTTGYGFIRSDGQNSEWIAHGDINTSAKDAIEKRLGHIFKTTQELLAQYQPDVVAIEDVFLAASPAIAIKLGHARSAVICATVDRNVRVFSYSAKQIKRAVVGRGGADKEQVAYMVERLLNILGKKRSHDATDALAAALCHAHSQIAKIATERKSA